MKSLFLIASIAGALAGSFAAAHAQEIAAPAPPWQCEIHLTSWCIAEGSYELTRKPADDGIHDRIWSMRGRFRPESRLIILEPNGCKTGLSDTTRLLQFEPNVTWHKRYWDRAVIRLKSDTSCDLTLLMPPDRGDPMEWAFTSGLPLVRPCKDQACYSEGLVLLKPELLKLRHKGK